MQHCLLREELVLQEDRSVACSTAWHCSHRSLLLSQVAAELQNVDGWGLRPQRATVHPAYDQEPASEETPIRPSGGSLRLLWLASTAEGYERVFSAII